MREQCTATAKQTGKRCKRSAYEGYKVCYMHGARGGGPRPENKNAVRHGVYETLIRERLPEDQREAFDRTSVATGLEAELRINRFKMLRLMGEVNQNIVISGRDSRVAVIKADELAKIEAIIKLSDNIRKLVKDMQDVEVDDALLDIVDGWKEGMASHGERSLQSPAPNPGT